MDHCGIIEIDWFSEVFPRACTPYMWHLDSRCRQQAISCLIWCATTGATLTAQQRAQFCATQRNLARTERNFKKGTILVWPVVASDVQTRTFLWIASKFSQRAEIQQMCTFPIARDVFPLYIYIHDLSYVLYNKYGTLYIVLHYIISYITSTCFAHKACDIPHETYE